MMPTTVIGVVDIEVVGMEALFCELSAKLQVTKNYRERNSENGWQSGWKQWQSARYFCVCRVELLRQFIGRSLTLR
jgi:hypothetical protein